MRCCSKPRSRRRRPCRKSNASYLILRMEAASNNVNDYGVKKAVENHS
jgi:hypothetical protein